MPETNFQRLLELLADSDVEFVVVGGLAATFHGSAYVTYDIDVCYHRTPENVRRLCAALAVVKPTLRDAPPDLPFRLDPPAVLAGFNFTLDTQLGALDLLAEIDPLGEYPGVLEHSEEAELYGRRVRVLRLPSLVRAKQAAGRTKDQLVLPELEALLELRDKPAA